MTRSKRAARRWYWLCRDIAAVPAVTTRQHAEPRSLTDVPLR